MVGLSQAMVSKILCAYQKQGLAVFTIASPKGTVAKLSADQLGQLPALLDKGAGSYGSRVSYGHVSV